MDSQEEKDNRRSALAFSKTIRPAAWSGARVRRAARTRLNACASCRNAAISVAFTDGKYVGVEMGVLNAPTIFALFLRIVQFAFVALLLTEQLAINQSGTLR